MEVSKVVIAASLAATFALPQAVSAQGPLSAPKNPFAANSSQAIPHGDPAQQGATYVNGLMAHSRQFKDDELVYQHLDEL